MSLPAHAFTLSINYSPRSMPPMCKLFILERGPLVISDIVGFIRELPHTLVAAFRAILEKIIQANMSLHVVDAGSPNRNERVEEITTV